MFYIFGTLMTANENLKQLNMISFVGLVLNLIFNFVLIPKYAASGAAFTTMVTQVFAGLMQLFFVFKHFKLKLNYRLLGQFFLFGILFVGLNYILDIQMETGVAKVFIAGMGGALLLIISGTIRPREILRLMKSEN